MTTSDPSRQQSPCQIAPCATTPGEHSTRPRKRTLRPCRPGFTEVLLYLRYADFRHSDPGGRHFHGGCGLSPEPGCDGQDTRRSPSSPPNCGEEGVEGIRFDRQRALELIAVLEGLAADPQAIPNHLDDLKTISATAAQWAAGAASPSPELHASVALRAAAGELREYAVRPTPAGLDKARYELEQARHALTTTVGRRRHHRPERPGHRGGSGPDSEPRGLAEGADPRN